MGEESALVPVAPHRRPVAVLGPRLGRSLQSHQGRRCTVRTERARHVIPEVGVTLREPVTDGQERAHDREAGDGVQGCDHRPENPAGDPSA